MTYRWPLLRRVAIAILVTWLAGCSEIPRFRQRYSESRRSFWLCFGTYSSPSILPTSRTSSSSRTRRSGSLTFGSKYSGGPWLQMCTFQCPMELITSGDISCSKYENNVHFFSWSQNDLGIPLGLLTEGSIEVCNKDVKQVNRWNQICF